MSKDHPNPFAQDAARIAPIITENYAYLDRFHNDPLSGSLLAQAQDVTDIRSLIRYGERALLSLADHHATLGSSVADSWALVPSHTDLWVELQRGAFVIDAMRGNTAAITLQDRIIAVGGVPIDQAVADFWVDLGITKPDDDRCAFAARTLVAGRRDGPRNLTIDGSVGRRDVALPSRYHQNPPCPPFVSTTTDDDTYVIGIENALGEAGTIAAFDAAMGVAKPGQPIVLDLTNTPGGGNTNVARAIMGWFTAAPAFYQMHRYVAEERATGIVRQWVEQVLPRPGKYHDGPVCVRVGRWTGSMGEGLAIGMQALGATLEGQNMAGLRGAIHEFSLPHSGLRLRIPAEQLFTVDGTPREDVVVGQCQGPQL